MNLTYITLKWTTTSPVSVSAGELGSDAFDQATPAEVDLPIRRDIHQRLVVPGTSVAGALRAALPIESRDAIMGTAPKASPLPSKPSPLSLLGVEIHGTQSLLHHHTAMDRSRGAARTSTLHSRESIAEGQRLTVRMVLKHTGPASRDTLLETLQHWRPRLGSGASVGRGSLQVDEVRYRTLDLSSDADLAIHLSTGGPAGVDALVADGDALALHGSAPEPLIDVAFEIVDALHVGAGGDRSSGKAAPILRDASGKPLVPGSSLKGVVRSRVEYLLRSLGGRACLDGRCGDCPTCLLFGYGGGESGPSGSGVGRRSAVGFRNAAIAVDPVERIHVSVDRFTGGALDGALYKDEVVDFGTFAIVVDPLHGETPEWASGLILAALIDLDDGLIGIGGSTTRGYGTVRAVGGPLADQKHGEATAKQAAREALLAATASYPADGTEAA